MLVPVPLRDQIIAQRGDRLRVLIVGAGVAGVTLARLLRAVGLHPVLVDRAQPGGAAGYMLGLLPLVDPVLGRLGLERAYLEASIEMRSYRLWGATGRLLREDRLDDVVGRFGHYRGIARSTLLDLLAGDATAATFGTTITGLREEQGVRVVLNAVGADVEVGVDVVVGADGLHSGVRGLLLRADEVSRVDTGWGGWVAWAESDADADRYEEVWGDGFFLGLYPVADRTGVFLGGPRAALAAGPAAMAALVRARLQVADERLLRGLEAAGHEPAPYVWSFVDARSTRWATGRTILLGDAAAAFLPTAGVGAAMAIESAGVLAARLTATTPHTVPQTLADYQRTQRRRVEAAQQASRRLARLMFRDGRVSTRVRDRIAGIVGVRTALAPILRLLRNQPDRPPEGRR